MTTIIYTRFSPRPEAIDVQSINVQIAACEAYCVMKSLGSVEIIRDPETSARKTALKDRPGGAQLLEMVESGSVQHVVCQKLDRIFRNTVDGLMTMDLFDRHGVSLHFADQGGCSLNCSTATGKLVMTFLLGVASFEPEMTAERTSGAMRRYQGQGRSMGGIAPIGSSKDGKALVENADERQAIQLATELSLKGWGYHRIASHFTELGLTCRGAKWYPETVRRILKRAKESA